MKNLITTPTHWAIAFKFKTFCVAAVAALFAVAVQSANADMMTVDLNDSNFVPGIPAPYGKVTLNGDTTTGIVTLTLDTTHAGDLFQEFGFSSSVDDSHFSVSNNAGWTNNGPGSFNISTFGTFDYDIQGTGGTRVSQLVVTVQFTMGNFGEALTSNFVVANSDGKSFVAHLIPDNASGFTGFIADGPSEVPGIPEPASVLLFGLGAFGLAGLRYRKGRREA